MYPWVTLEGKLWLGKAERYHWLGDLNKQSTHENFKSIDRKEIPYFTSPYFVFSLLSYSNISIVQSLYLKDCTIELELRKCDKEVIGYLSFLPSVNNLYCCISGECGEFSHCSQMLMFSVKGPQYLWNPVYAYAE